MLVTATDGVGTKLLLAQETGRLDTVGIDLVAMSVNDVLTVGARPILFLDYVAVGRLVPAEMAQIVAGVAEGCRQAGCALVGGEMAEMPGLYDPGEFDLAGFCVGLGERAQADRRLGDRGGRRRPRPCFERPALQRLLAGAQGAGGERTAAWATSSRSFDETIADTLLGPPASTCGACSGCSSRACPSEAMAHITGGGIAGNLSRVIPDGLSARLHFEQLEDPAGVPGPPAPGRHLRRGDVPHLQHGRGLRAGGARSAAEPRPSGCWRRRARRSIHLGEIASGRSGQR